MLFTASLFLGDAGAAVPRQPKWAGLYENELVSMETVHTKQLNNVRFVLFDARSSKSFYEGHIPGALLPYAPEYYEKEELFRQGRLKELPESDAFLEQAMKMYPKDVEIVTYCSDGCQASAVLVFKLKKLGYKYSRAMENGFQAWQAKNYPVSARSNTPLSACMTCG